MPWIRSLCTLFLCTLALRAGDWPQWLGPTRDGASPEKIAPWKKAPKTVWRKPVGEGNSAPVVANGRVFIHAKVRDKNVEEVVAFDAKTGKELWRTPYPRPAFTSLYGNGARATPAVVGGKVYTYGITGILSCFEADTGKRAWQVDALKEFNAKNLVFGVSCSPLVAGKNVIVAVGGKDHCLAAFDKDTGEEAWKSQSDGASYSSPILVEDGKSTQLIYLSALGMISLNPTDGSLYWRSPLKDLLLESSTTPVRVGGLVLASSITYGSAGLRLGEKDGKPTVKQAWKNKALTSYFSTPVPVGLDHVYMVTGVLDFSGRGQASLHCVEAKTGKELWTRSNVGKYHASLMRTGDNKLLMLEEFGDLVLFDPSPKEYREMARATVCGHTWAHPALANGRLYVRDDKDLICLQFGE